MLDARLNDPSVEVRLNAARTLGDSVKKGVKQTEEVNNHVHTIYSFSPYSPSMAAAMAARAGLQTVGIMDHDSVAGCEEMLEACKAIGIASTAGCEIRVNMDGTRMEGRKTNNPDEPNVSYIAFHGIPRPRLTACANFLTPIHDARILRDREEVKRLNVKLAKLGLEPLDFDRDVVSISEADRGGTITERHILYAVAMKLIKTFGKGARTLDVVEQQVGVAIPAKLKELLLDASNPHYVYDLLGVFKSTLVADFFIPSSKQECVNVVDAVKFANDIGAIPAYAYLGDVGESPTGDKKAEKFEDDYLDLLVPELREIGFRAITYMPPRNTKQQLLRLQKLCQQNGLMEISGVDINSSRQSFNCPILLEPEFRHLTDAAWALIAHEKLAAAKPKLGLFHPDNPLRGTSMDQRIARYAALGRRINHHHPENAVELVDF
jgi:hypothetical protein